MPVEKIRIPFNRDAMTVRDLKKCAETLKLILRAHDCSHGVSEHSELGRVIDQHRDAFEVY